MAAPHDTTSWHYFGGGWHAGNPPMIGPMSHSIWMASCVFDGARAFEGVTPDLDLHCQRLIASAGVMGLHPTHGAGEIEEILREGITKFPKDTALYLRPMFWAEEGFVAPEGDSTNYCFSLMTAPMPQPKAMSVMRSSFRRPAADQAMTSAKAACLYPNSGRALMEAAAAGYDNGVVMDAMGNVAELATANIWMAKDGAAHTPIPNGTFLNGITRQRTIKLLRDAGITVHERVIAYPELLEADELFTTGNYGKVLPITRIDQRDLQPGPVYAKARELYWAWSHGDF